ncbi:unnamed protein product [Coffea canephora]|uniref:DH200=94 genomic scaffold, scaffold_177 n=1 Tax=Coffea canephora TaxID=49390 RepID=A0A068VAK1_COFCA|nr:unnamed protein product [Coffea canephora]
MMTFKKILQRGYFVYGCLFLRAKLSLILHRPPPFCKLGIYKCSRIITSVPAHGYHMRTGKSVALPLTTRACFIKILDRLCITPFAIHTSASHNFTSTFKTSLTWLTIFFTLNPGSSSMLRTMWGRCTDSRQLGRNGTAWFQRTASDDKDVRDFLCRDVSDFNFPDILAAMDAAITDGVDVISLSLGNLHSPIRYRNKTISRYSTRREVISLANEAPWVLTLGASSIDKKIRASALLGNHEVLEGESAFQPVDFPSTLLPLVYPGSEAAYCSSESLNSVDVKGQVVLCQTGEISAITRGRNEHEGYTTSAEAHVLPATDVSYADAVKIMAYTSSTNSPTATIFFNGTAIGDFHAPVVASFSSRGPNQASPGILKLDIIGPGVNILAAWHKSVDNNTNTKATFNIISGTSMSCPHLRGVAVLLKSEHPDWSPAAIKICNSESSIPEAQLNYPSFSIILGSNLERYTKTVTNVGETNSSYTVQIAPPAGVDVTVEPSTLNFSGLNQKITYTFILEGEKWEKLGKILEKNFSKFLV